MNKEWTKEEIQRWHERDAQMAKEAGIKVIDDPNPVIFSLPNMPFKPGRSEDDFDLWLGGM